MELQLHSIAISIIIMSMLLLSASAFINDLGANYDKADFTGLENTQQRLNEQINLSRQLEENIAIITLQEDTSVLMIPYALIKAGWGLTKLMFSPWNTIGAIMSDIADTTAEQGIPIPAWLVVSIKAILWITLAAILIYAFFKWRFGA